MIVNFEVRDDRDQGYFRIDNAIVSEFGARLGPYGISVYCALAMYAGQKKSAYPSAKTLAKQVGCSERTVRDSLAKIVDLKLARKTRRHRDDGGWTSTLYTLIPIPGTILSAGNDSPSGSSLRQRDHRADRDVHDAHKGTARRAQGHLRQMPTNKTQYEQDAVKKEVAASAASAPSKNRRQTEQQEYFGAVAEACGMEPGLMDGRTSANVGKLASHLRNTNGVDPEYIRRCGRLWYGQWPDRPLSDITAPGIAQFKTWIGKCRQGNYKPHPADMDERDGAPVFWSSNNRNSAPLVIKA